MVGNKKRILVIDDDAAVRSSFCAYLEDCGYQTAGAADGEVALGLVEQDCPDLLLLDLRMPGLDGLQLLHRVQDERPELPVIVISGNGVIEDVVQALRLGAWDYLTKPLHDMAVLNHAVERALERARLLWENRNHQMHLEAVIARRTAELEMHRTHLEELVAARTHDLQRQIEERELVEASLRFSEQRFRDISEISSDWIWEMDAGLRFSYVSPRLMDVFGLSASQVLGHTRSELAGEAELARAPEKWRAHLETLDLHQPFRNFEYTIAKFDGSKLVVQLSGRPYFDEQGQFLGFRGTGTDITNLRMAQIKLLQAEKMAALGELVAGIAHEINTPVGIGVTASTHLQALVRRFHGRFQAGEATQQDLQELLDDTEQSSDVIYANLRRAAELIRSFKQVAVDQSSLARRRFNLRQYLEEILLSLHPRLKTGRHRVVLECPQDIELDSYPGALSQVLTNLIMNSLTHAFDGGVAGRIRIQAQATKGRLNLIYSDDGRGMDKAQAKRLFDPFFTTHRGGGGTGLGMHIVFNLVTDTLAGKIDCTTSPGKGMQFHIQLPIKR